MTRSLAQTVRNQLVPELAGASQVGAPSTWYLQPQSGKVVSVDDPDGRGRVQVELLALDPSGDTQLWARVATGFAGDNYGMFALPGIDEEVIVTFLGGDPAFPVVVGALWNGATEMPEDQPSGDVKVWGLNGREGSRMTIDESRQGGEAVVLETPNGVKVELKDGGNKILLSNGTMKITLHNEKVEIESTAEVSVSSANIKLDAPMMQCTAALATFDGVINCQTLVTNSVVSSSYTPGAGNIW